MELHIPMHSTSIGSKSSYTFKFVSYFLFCLKYYCDTSSTDIHYVVAWIRWQLCNLLMYAQDKLLKQQQLQDINEQINFNIWHLLENSKQIVSN